LFILALNFEDLLAYSSLLKMVGCLEVGVNILIDGGSDIVVITQSIL